MSSREPHMNANLSVFGDVKVTAELVDSNLDPDRQFATIRMGRLYVAFDLPTARDLHAALSEALTLDRGNG